MLPLPLPKSLVDMNWGGLNVTFLIDTGATGSVLTKPLTGATTITVPKNPSAPTNGVQIRKEKSCTQVSIHARVPHSFVGMAYPKQTATYGSI